MYAAFSRKGLGSERYIEKAVMNCQVTIQEMTVREPLMMRRNAMGDVKTMLMQGVWDKFRGYLLTV